MTQQGFLVRTRVRVSGQRKWELTRGHVIKDESWWPDEDAGSGIPGRGNKRQRGVRTAEMMKGSGKKPAKRQRRGRTIK